MHITELNLYASNLLSIKNFYGDILSLKIISESEEHVTFQAGTTLLTFKKSNPGENPFYHFAFNIPSNKLEEAKDWMNGKAELLPISDNNYIADFENWNAKSIYFLDPEGNIAEFIARFDLKNDSDKNFGSSQILSVSEMGIVTDNVSKLRQKFIDEYKVFDFAKSTNSETFSAMGDDNGLFVIPIENRNWYPTQMPSRKSPFEVKFINDVRETFILSDKTM